MISYIYSKYKFKCLLIKDPSETSSLEYIIITNYTVSFFYYTDICFCVLTLQFGYEMEGRSLIYQYKSERLICL